MLVEGILGILVCGILHLIPLKKYPHIYQIHISSCSVGRFFSGEFSTVLKFCKRKSHTQQELKVCFMFLGFGYIFHFNVSKV